MVSFSARARNQKTIIEISPPKLVGKSRIENTFLFDKSLEKFFQTKEFYIEYGVEINSTNEGLLNIPAIVAILPIAWLTGADVKVTAVDRTFFRSMGLLQKEYSKYYPKPPWKTEIHADKLTDNKIGAEGKAIGFSGGLDSIYSVARHFEENPLLMFIEGWDIPLEKTEYMKMIRNYFNAFARRAALRLSWIRTNVRYINKGESYGYLNKLIRGNVWGSIQQQIWQTGLIAPLSIGRFNIHLTAAGSRLYCTKESPQSCGLNTTELIGWADLKCKYDGGEDRWNKIKESLWFIDKFELKLKVCYVEYEKLNCSKCEKCTRTIFHLLGLDLNPNDYGLACDEETIEALYDRIEKKVGMGYLWPIHYTAAIKNLHPKKDLYGSMKFFEWMRKNYKSGLSPAERFYMKER